MAPLNAPRFCILPASADFADWAARRILQAHAGARPDLTHVTVLLPASGIGRMRAALGRAAGGALLGPRITTLTELARAAGGAGAAATAHECRLLIVEALRRHPALFEGQDLWRVGEALFELFEEMTLAGYALPGAEAEFTGQLTRAYGAPAVAYLSLEARRVHTLWQSFQADSAGRSPASVYARAVRAAFAQLGGEHPVYLAAFERLHGVEIAALAPALKQSAVHVWLHGRTSGRDGEALLGLCRRLGISPEPPADAPGGNALLDATFEEPGMPLAERGARLRGSGTALPLAVTEASGPEHEARCVELAVREAWLAGARDIAVVAPDRRLARRVRALLERAGLRLRDDIGWALSTSRAAAALACWLDCEDSDFHFRPLLDLLKSGFVELPPEAEAGIGELERDVVFGRDKVASGLRRFRMRLDPGNPLQPVLQRLAAAARSGRDGRNRPLGDWLRATARALRALGMWTRLQADAAGARLLEELEGLARAAGRQPLSCRRAEFRILLDRTLEQATFSPESGASGVRLLTLEQGALLSCDTLILANATRAALPGRPPADPFFSDGVRAQLGLPDWQQHRAVSLARLRRMLEAAPQVRATFAPEVPGEPGALSPWLEAVESVAQAAGVPAVRDHALAQRAGASATEVAAREGPPVPHPDRPAPAAPALVPTRLSATAHQSLVDCPYQFYARRCLRLNAPEAPDEEPGAREFGQRVHRILHAFHAGDAGLPPPFEGPVTAHNREQAAARLEEIALAVLAQDLEARIVTHAWLERFRGLIPVLTGWLAERSPDWPQVECEAELERSVDPALVLEGRVDRLERAADGSASVADYKTGTVPRVADVESGEAVQLLHYGLLAPQTRRLEYWDLKKGVQTGPDPEALPAALASVQRRLLDAMAALRDGAGMPAHGDDDTCRFCDFGGLCRKGYWDA